jgi:hypothetical protein
MKKLIYIIMFACSFSMNGQTLKEIVDVLGGKTETSSKKVMYKEVLNEVVTINSTSNEMFSGGNSRQALYVKLPVGTKKWYYRVTPIDVSTNYNYQPRESFISLLSNDYPLFVNNRTNYGFNFYIINDYALSDFYAKRTFNVYTNYTRENTLGFYNVCDLVYSNLMICLTNTNVKQGLKVIVEVVAYGDF